MKNPRVIRRKEISKIRAEINAKETKETIVKINKGKSSLGRGPYPAAAAAEPVPAGDQGEGQRGSGAEHLR